MSENQHRFLQLYHHFINDTASPEEVREFWALTEMMEGDIVVKEALHSLYNDQVPEEVTNKDWSKAGESIFGRKKKVLTINKKHWLAAAASVIIVLGIGSFFFNNEKNDLSKKYLTNVVNTEGKDVAPPASNRATITLANGQSIPLDSFKSGTLALQNNIVLTKTSAGKIEYSTEVQEKSRELVFNTLTNPRGSRVINMVLNDGSEVWLNAASSITYPVAFKGNVREVTVTGEAYFEIAHDVNKKFIVKTNGLLTEVLGTHFNVNAYLDEDEIKVTLLEGSVQVVANNGSSSLIKPGEQVMASNGKMTLNSYVNVEDVIAWKNERFSFKDTNIKNIMREVARWYDVQIDYKGKMDDLNFGGSMSRQENVSELLKRMEATQAVKFEVAGRKITVIKMP